jgi:hypothetical protein
MNRNSNDCNKPVRYGNSFPWVGMLAGVKRMVYYLLLLAGLLLVLGAIVLMLLSAVDTEPVGDYF